MAMQVTESDTIVAARQAENIRVMCIVHPDEGHLFQKPSKRLSYITTAEASFT
jgi:hypothetical protein